MAHWGEPAPAPAPDATHPAVRDVLANNATDSAAQHQARVAQALAGVQGDVAVRDEAKRQEILAGGDQVTAGTVVLGGSTIGTLDAATLPEAKRRNALGVSMLAQSQRPNGPRPEGQALTMDQWATYGDYATGQSGVELGQYKLRPPPSKEERAREKREHPELATQKGERGPDGKLIEDADNPGFRGMAVSPAEIQQNPDELLRSNELALATAETRRQSEVPFVPGQPIGSVQVRPTEPRRPPEGDASAYEKYQRDMERWPKGPDGKPVASYVECQMLNPDGTPAMEQKPKVGADGRPVIDSATGQPVVEDRPVTKKVCATESMDICVGPGPGRKLGTGDFDVPDTAEEKKEADEAARRARKDALPPMSKDDQRQLMSTGSLQTAEEYLGGRAKVQEGERVLVAGGGASGAWAAQSAAAAGAGQVDWQGRPATPRPPSTEEYTDAEGNRKVRFTPFGELENKVQKQVESLAGKTPTPEQAAEMEATSTAYNAKLREEEGRLLDEAKRKAEEAKRKLATLPAAASPAERQRLEDEIKKQENDAKNLESPDKGGFGGGDLDRNKDTPGQKKAKNILRVVPITDGEERGKTRVFYEDGTFETYDKVITAMGQDEKAEGGPVELMKDVEKLVPIWEGDPPQPVGLQTPGGEVRVMGASAWMVKDKILDVNARRAFEQKVIQRSGRKESSQQQVSADSTGVDWGFEAVGDNPARANSIRARMDAT
jgi:hypothetical protein